MATRRGRLLVGDYAQATLRYERALAIHEKAGDPNALYEDCGLGRLKVVARQFDAAEVLLEKARALGEKTYGASHPVLAQVFLGKGELALARRGPKEAVPLLEHALGLHDSEIDSEIRLVLAEALFQAGMDRPRARSLAEQARATYQRLGHAPGLDQANRWLAEHPLE